MALEPISAYVTLPDPILGIEDGDAVVELPQDGTPPNFGELLNAIQKVLARDPCQPVALAALTREQCRHIAREIAWNRHIDPLPSVSAEALEDMYTAPFGEEEPERRKANERAQFQAELTQYHAIHDAKAEILAKYIFALSAAIACEIKSIDALRAGLRFPIQPGVSPSGKVQEAEVALEN